MNIYHEIYEKPSRILAQQLKSKLLSQSTIQIWDSKGNATFDPTKSNDTFAEFYLQLFTSESSSDDTQMQDFFHELDIPKITIEHSKQLESPLMLSKVTNAINAMQNV